MRVHYGYSLGVRSLTPASLTDLLLRCPGAAHDDVNLVPGSLPIEVEQGRRTESQVITQFLATAHLTLEADIDDLDQQQLSVVLTSV